MALHSRMARVSALVQAELGKIIDQRVSDPQVPSFVTVHSVRVAADLRVADVYVTFLEDDPAKIDEAMAALNRSAGFIRRELGHEIRLKYLPALKFHFTPATQEALRLEQLLREKNEPGEAVGEIGQESDEEE